MSESLSVGLRFGMVHRFYDRGPCSQSSKHIHALNSRTAAEGVRYVEKLTGMLEPEALERARARGRAMDLEASVDEALASD